MRCVCSETDNDNDNKDIYNAQIRRGSKCAVSGQYWRETSSISVWRYPAWFSRLVRHPARKRSWYRLYPLQSRSPYWASSTQVNCTGKDSSKLDTCDSVAQLCRAINRSRVRLPAAALPSSDPGQVVHMCLAPLNLRPYDAIEIWVF